MLAAGADVLDEKVVLGDRIPLLGMVPLPPRVGDEPPIAVDQGVVDGNESLVAVAGGGAS
jgi:hypothetical protein